MDWIDKLVGLLSDCPDWGYHAEGPPAAEPTALAALALLSWGETRRARRGLQWLTQIQSAAGSVGVTESQAHPTWPTAWAVTAWNYHDQQSGRVRFRRAIECGRRWMLAAESHTHARPKNLGHDTTLLGWPWAEGTHAWVEPTALHVLALKAIGDGQHPRTREAVRLLLDRQLPGGGCNYGNTFVLNQKLRAQAQPTGLAALALVGETANPRLQQSLHYLARVWPRIEGTASRCYAALALVAHRQPPEDLVQRLSHLTQRPRFWTRAGAYPLALIALASLSDRSPLSLPPQGTY